MHFKWEESKQDVKRVRMKKSQPKLCARELMNLVTNGDCECCCAHNKCDIVPTFQEPIKVSNQLSWTLVLTQNTFQEKKKKKRKLSPLPLSATTIFMATLYFHGSMHSFLSFFRLKKAPALRQESMLSHTPAWSIQTEIPKKKSPFQAVVRVWAHLASILFFYCKIRLT